MITELLTLLGDNIVPVIVACIELVAAALLAARALDTAPVRRRVGLPGGAAGQMLRELNTSAEEVQILFRRKDMMPVYVVGDIEGLLGVTPDDLQNDIACLLPQMADKAAGRAFWKAYGAWDGMAHLEDELRLKDGQWFRVTMHRSKNGEYDVATLHRSTELHEQIAHYEESLREAEEASRSKTTFLSCMSHEIRTPMNGIIGMLTLAKSRLTPDHPAMQYLDKADELSDHLLSLINDILDMSRIEAGKVELEAKPFSLHELGQKLYDMFAKNLEARGIRYEVEYENVSVDYVIGDELRISQVIINFLSNAVKFTEKGEIIVTLRQMMQRDDVVDLMFRVHDTGIGMDPQFISRIFRPFEQESIETGHKYGGTGLGMAITDQIVRLMGGEIVVESVPGKGSDFSVFLHLPIAAAPAKPAATAAPAENAADENVFRGCHVLMAEDNEVNAMIAVEIMGEMGAQVDVAENGQKAVEAFAAHPQDYYDFILMDVQMPVMDGRTAARTIRAMNRPDAATVLIFALSADAFVEDERLSKEAGMNAHYAKPVNFTELQRNVGRFLHEKERNRT
ncbi:ATP-binding protein [Gemmiger sp.]